MDLLECPICLFLMCEPATMSCGHTFCRSCLGNYLSSGCPACKEIFKQRDAKNIKNNILLFNVIEKCCPEETRIKCHILEKLKTSEFTEALRIANEGIRLGRFLKIMCELEHVWGRHLLMQPSSRLQDRPMIKCVCSLYEMESTHL